MDRIVLAGLEFHAHHGVFAAEGELGARFVVDVELFLPLSRTDDLAATVDYGAVYALVRARVTGERFALIEALAVDIATRLLAAHPPPAARAGAGAQTARAAAGGVPRRLCGGRA